jgi:hypothetical protein
MPELDWLSDLRLVGLLAVPDRILATAPLFSFPVAVAELSRYSMSLLTIRFDVTF